MSFVAVVENEKVYLAVMRKVLRYGKWKNLDFSDAPSERGDYIIAAQIIGELPKIFSGYTGYRLYKFLRRIPGVKKVWASGDPERAKNILNNMGGESFETYFEPPAKQEAKSSKKK